MNNFINDNQNSENTKFLNSDRLINSPFFSTVFDAIRSSGGITQFSDLTSIKVIRKNSISNGGGKIQTTINF